MQIEQLKIHKGRPENITERQEREQRVYNMLDSLGIEYERVDHQPAMTMEVCAQIDQAFGRMAGKEWEHSDDPEKGQHSIICKNLFLTNKQHSRFFLLMMPGDKKFLTKDLSHQINSARLSFASAQEMLQFLDIEPGSVSIMGLMNDKDKTVQLLIDRDILQSDYFGCHPCVNTSSLRIRTKDLLEKIIPTTGHNPIIVEL